MTRRSLKGIIAFIALLVLSSCAFFQEGTLSVYNYTSETAAASGVLELDATVPAGQVGVFHYRLFSTLKAENRFASKSIEHPGLIESITLP